MKPDHCQLCYADDELSRMRDDKPLRLERVGDEWLCEDCADHKVYWQSLTPEEQQEYRSFVPGEYKAEGTI